MITWTFPGRTAKTPRWYLTGAIVALALVVWGYLMQMYIMSIVVFLLVGVYMLYENNSPDTIDVILNNDGILISGVFYDYAKIESFRVLYLGREPFALRIHLREQIALMSRVDLRLTPDIDPTDVRVFLMQYLPEHESGELTTTERIIHALNL